MKKFIAATVAVCMMVGGCCAEGMPKCFETIEQVDVASIRGALIITDLVYDIETHVVYYRTFGAYGCSLTPYVMIDSFGTATVGIYDTHTETIVPAEAYFMYEDDDIEAVG